ncbi:hypothetical protein CDV55_100121 [Aspergillus turcosus]|uniref:Protein argonaute N-terminal domain-containing protein n=1 Tax=Aspergillus turcosus TaxID=1245748 RepID=A0A397GYT3_9EURO|nr:hypothetical protein CDV55_100121 [Aspergillus turcosus]RLL94767.1 hypothetical protein CFD26_105004 [Aspergillus turcosus]
MKTTILLFPSSSLDSNGITIHKGKIGCEQAGYNGDDEDEARDTKNRDIVFLDNVVRNPNGKVDFAIWRLSLEVHESTGQTFIMPDKQAVVTLYPLFQPDVLPFHSLTFTPDTDFGSSILHAISAVAVLPPALWAPMWAPASRWQMPPSCLAPPANKRKRQKCGKCAKSHTGPCWPRPQIWPPGGVHNQTGKEIEVLMNAYPITKFPTRNVYQYDVQIGNGVEKNAVIKKVWNCNARKAALKQIVFDGQKLAWSMNNYPNGLNVVVDLFSCIEAIC